MDTKDKTQCKDCKKWYDNWKYSRCPELECREKRRREIVERKRKGYYGRVKTLNIIADVFMIFGIVLAIVIWVTMGIIYGDANPIGIMYGFIVLSGTIINWAVLRVICVIADNTIVIIENSNKAIEDKINNK